MPNPSCLKRKDNNLVVDSGYVRIKNSGNVILICGLKLRGEGGFIVKWVEKSSEQVLWGHVELVTPHILRNFTIKI